MNNSSHSVSNTGMEGKFTALGGKYLTFRLGAEEYGLEILKVQEIIGMMNITRIPRVPPAVRGVINLRGKIIPVIDLRVRFGMEDRPDTERTCIIVVQVDAGDRKLTMGIIGDEVSEVKNIHQDQIENAPSWGSLLDHEYLLGMAKMDGGVRILLNIDRVLSGINEWGTLETPDKASATT